MDSKALSADRTEKRMGWALDRFDQRVQAQLKASNQDKRLPLSSAPKGEAEELDLLQQQLPDIQRTLSLPEDPSTNPYRLIAQKKMVRYVELFMKIRGSNAVS